MNAGLLTPPGHFSVRSIRRFQFLSTSLSSSIMSASFVRLGFPSRQSDAESASNRNVCLLERRLSTDDFLRSRSDASSCPRVRAVTPWMRAVTRASSLSPGTGGRRDSD
jgi:hypothetical protein